MHTDINAPRSVLWRLASGSIVTNGSPESRGTFYGFGRKGRYCHVQWNVGTLTKEGIAYHDQINGRWV